MIEASEGVVELIEKVSKWEKAQSAVWSSKECSRQSVMGRWARHVDVCGHIQKTTLLVKV